MALFAGSTLYCILVIHVIYIPEVLAGAKLAKSICFVGLLIGVFVRLQVSFN